MSAHDQMRAMLDQLMGTGRNGNETIAINCRNQPIYYIFKTLIYLQEKQVDTKCSSMMQKCVRVSYCIAVRMIYWHLP